MLSALCVALLAAAALAGADENRLQNPGFEVLDASDMPVRWKFFVMPQNQAFAESDSGAAEAVAEAVLSETAYAGAYSAMLRTPEPYAQEPYNNWSQAVFGAFGGETMTLTGHIKTEDASEAALWLQCWRQNPPRILTSASTAWERAVYGTRDWTEVSLTLDVPERTDFLVVRCVLTGTGSAWFDSLTLSVVEEKPAEEEEATAEAEEPEAGQPEAEVEDEEPQPRQTSTAEMEALLAANEALRESLRALSESNDAFARQIQALQQELGKVRQELEATKRVQEQIADEVSRKEQPPPREEPTAPREFPPAPLLKPPPIIPHGEPVEKYLIP